MAFQTALIVDDSKLARVTLKKKLESHGLLVELVDSARQAYAALPAMQPDIIFMDHLMPEVDGFEATQYIRQMSGFQQIPIVMCTGKEQDGYLEEALAIGANFILSKPPVDEALNAILAWSPKLTEVDPEVLAVTAVNTVLESDMAEYQEPVIESDVPDQDLAAMPETDVADFMAEVESAEPAASIVAPVAQQELSPVIVTGIHAGEVERICTQMIQEALAALPEPSLPVMALPVVESQPVDMEQILSTVNAAVSHQLAVASTSLKSQLQTDLGVLITEKITQALDQDIQGILDLRLNVMLAEKFADTHALIANLEKQLDEKAGNASDMSAVDTPIMLEQPDKLHSRMDQLHQIERLFEEHVQFIQRVKILQVAAIGSAALALAAMIVAFVM